MFEELLRELRQLEGGYSVSLSPPSDEEGYFDRECPSPECQFAFKIHDEDWRDIVRDEEVFCPFCGHTADSGSWWSQDQFEQAEKAVTAQIANRLGGAMKRDADRWNRGQPRDSFVTMTMNVDNRPRHVPLPRAAESMQLKIACPECECRYAVVGAAFFCPACGHNAAEQMFSQSVTAIRSALDALDTIRSAAADRDTGETIARLLVENGLQHAVTAFQRLAEALYGRYLSAPAARRNAFQNLAEGSELWFAATGRRFSDYIRTSELEATTRHFQRRHLLAHTQGIVDEDYVNRSGDTSYRVGQRIVVGASSVEHCVDLIEKLASGMQSEQPQRSEAGP